MGSIAFKEKNEVMAAKPLGGFMRGEVVIREGQACLVVAPPPTISKYVDENPKGPGSDPQIAQFSYEGRGHNGVPLVNLKTGNMWWTSPNDLVWPAWDVELGFSTHRSG